MNIKPILFSTPMVQAILEGRKTQTRRVIKSKHESGLFQIEKTIDGVITEITSLDWDERPKNDCCNDIKPIANIGDIFWVRESWLQIHKDVEFEGRFSEFVYRANSIDNENKYGHIKNPVGKRFIDSWKWKPSIFMPKEAARIFLKVNGIRVERLHDISEEDSISEGIEKMSVWKNRLVENLYTNYMKDGRGPQTPRLSFFSLWEAINGKDSLASNPYVWVYDFCKVEKPINFI
ncbi:hypothetical protein [Sphingobacterium sp.]|uniref:hypothetical protein n=1 Tax=Sphingobacterium sp. TaxID=341027 RepID=UPI0028AE4AA9|nr:hypothetical protein [Sphingobacterium sp.]